MNDENYSRLKGNVGSVEVRETPKCLVATFSVATNFVWRDRKTGEKKGEKEWHNVVAFGAVAEYVRDHAYKGARVQVEGRKKTNRWTDPETDADRFMVQVVAKSVDVLVTSKPESSGEQSTDRSDGKPKPRTSDAQAPDLNGWKPAAVSS